MHALHHRSAQYLIGKVLRWYPISGFDADLLARLPLPGAAADRRGLLSGIGGDVRFYRTVFLEESGRDFVRTARAKGASEARIMTHHVLRNALIPILTRVVLAIPFLFMGVAAAGGLFWHPRARIDDLFDAIQANDFSTMRTMVYVGSLALHTSGRSRRTYLLRPGRPKRVRVE